ncbi:DUF934 domain-containing protein [Noviherbaspirillum sp.]|uniref:DUF934 domain-containing protein n=1 Tax=Noviherbaspirillum sp. TaxID=1926288 RepID=UPI0025D7D072|nr:DUF934 domain-containing protein [Noviherbaspirillum sp.]
MSKIIKLLAGMPQVVEDRWCVMREPHVPVAESSAWTIFPLSALQPQENKVTPEVRAVWIAPDDDFETLVVQLLKLDLIAVDFPVFRDGRGYSIATLLRTRYGWTGELRAIGDVLRDQLNYMRRCGFDSFAVRADKDIHDAIKSFTHYSVRYQGAVDDPVPLFRRRHG